MEKNKKISRCVGLRFVYSCLSIIVFLVVMYMLFNLYVLSVYVDQSIYKDYVSTAQQYSVPAIDKGDTLKSTMFNVPYYIQQYHSVQLDDPGYVCFKFVTEQLPAQPFQTATYEYYQYKKKPQVWSKLSGSTLDKFECIDKETLDTYGAIFQFYSRTILGTLYVCLIIFILFFVLMQAFCFSWCGCKFAACCILCGCTSESQEDMPEAMEQPQQPVQQPRPALSRNQSQVIVTNPSSTNLMRSPSMVQPPPMLQRNNSKIIIIDSNALKQQQQSGLSRQQSLVIGQQTAQGLKRQSSYVVPSITCAMAVADASPPTGNSMISRQSSILDVNQHPGPSNGLSSRSMVRGFKDDGSFAQVE